MRSSIAAGRGLPRLGVWLLPLLFFGVTDAGLLRSNAQEPPQHSIDGYVTSVDLSGGFDVNGQHILTSEGTVYGILGAKSNTNSGSSGSPVAGNNVLRSRASKESLHVGVFVRASGDRPAPTKAILATTVLFRDDWDRKLTGFGVIERVSLKAEPTAEPILVADGYRIRVGSGTEVSFGGNLKTLADVGPNTWVAYKGKRDGQGILVASSLKFVPARSHSSNPSPQKQKDHPTHSVQEPVPPGGGLIDVDGNMQSPHAKVRYADQENTCGWHRVPANDALQARVLRIGQRLIPAYQRQLPEDDPSMIDFRFYAVDEKEVRSELTCAKGLIMIPERVIDRLQGDDQVAALLADGIAYYIQIQSAQWRKQNLALLGPEIALDALIPFPLGIAEMVASKRDLGESIVGRSLAVKMQEQRGRMALSLMADAGYDPRQAPEAWRRLWQKNLPNDTDPVRYPDRSGYQLGILNLQYKDGAVTSNSQASITSSR